MNSGTRGIIPFGLFLFFTAFGQSTITDDNWVSLPGTNGGITSLATDKSNNLYAGGLFDTAGGIKVSNIARWNGSIWNALGSGINGRVYSLVVDDSGNLYAGGSFDTAGGVRTKNIARWDGIAWSALSNGTNGSVRSLTVNGSGHLFAAGQFDTAGDVRANHIALWDGNSWSALGNGLNYQSGAIAVEHSGNLYASDGMVAFKWEMAKWDTLCIVGGNSTVHTLAVDKSNNVYIGTSGWPGSSSIAGSGAGVHFYCIAQWNGSNWVAIGKNTWTSLEIAPAYVGVIAFDSFGNLFAGGNFRNVEGLDGNGIVRWDGNSWSALGTGLRCRTGVPNIEVNAIAIDRTNNLYISGNFDTAGGTPAAGLAKCMLGGAPVYSSLRGLDKHAEAPAIIGGNLFFSLAEASGLQLKVFNCAGRVILQSGPAVLGAGNHVMSMQSLSPGVYIVDFRAGNRSLKGKISIVK
jgi:trimeric autotransporter adhesin